ncbi:Fic family protein [Luteibacter sp. CQ10]|uniref:Fic family protein n=1 Tax=Luteibacter sp. CQ10 TaxID=2805821 RepID=UPI0034A3BD1B
MTTHLIQPSWIWQNADWPAFRWEDQAVSPLLRQCQQAMGRLVGMAKSSADDVQLEESLDALLANIVTSSAIEGEQLNVASVRSSLARRLGVADHDAQKPAPRSEGLAELMLDATRHPDEPLDMARLLRWHAWLFAAQDSLLPQRIRVGSLRGDEPMQVVSGRIDRPVVHFEAPPRKGLDAQVDAFLAWFARSRSDATLDPLLRAGITHLWFVTLHPFDDGNGRLTRALTDLALAQAEPQAIRFHAMSASILADRSGYYRILERTQRNGVDVTAWLEWFLRTLHDSLSTALRHIESVMAKARFWQQHREKALSPEQVKVLNRLLDGDFAHGINASQYQAVTKVSKATATRHLADMLDKGVLGRLPGGGRSTRYRVMSLGTPSDAP